MSRVLHLLPTLNGQLVVYPEAGSDRTPFPAGQVADRRDSFERLAMRARPRAHEI
jgi:hypothetical protein